MWYLKRGKARLNSRYISVFVGLFTNLQSTGYNSANAPEVLYPGNLSFCCLRHLLIQSLVRILINFMHCPRRLYRKH